MNLIPSRPIPDTRSPDKQALRRRSSALGLGLALTLFCAGCMPVTVYDSPRVKGQILNLATGAPIAGARVIVKPKPDIAVSGASDSDGRFDIAAIARRIWMPVPFDPAWPNANVEISAPGFESQTFSAYGLMADGTIRLKER